MSLPKGTDEPRGEHRPHAPKRVHPSGRLTFRSKVRASSSEGLRFTIAGDERIPWHEIVPGDWTGTIELEIGCGKGAFLLAAASSRPDVFFVGCEAGIEYARYCADRVRELDNTWLVADDARLFLADSVPDHSLARIHVYHPDPWPKRRHRKRRLFDQDFARDVVRTLVAGGELLVATDNTRYFGEILTVLGAEQQLYRELDIEARYGDEVPGLAYGPTNFAQKYVNEGRERHRAVYRTQVVSRSVVEHVRVHTGASDGWRKLCRLDALTEGLSHHVLGDVELCIARIGDRVHALRDSCPHRGAELSAGLLEGDEVICPWHGWRYSVVDGECSTLPGSCPATRFEVKIEGDMVLVHTGGRA